MRLLKLMADYGCYPLWEIFPDGIDNINPETLPISQTLKERLDKWSNEYDKTLNRKDPINSGFNSPRDERIFGEEGLSILKGLKNELEPLFEITYYIPETDT